MGPRIELLKFGKNLRQVIMVEKSQSQMEAKSLQLLSTL